MAEFSYDVLPYSSHAFELTSPESLAVVARLFGLRSPAIDTCRVLELGCASGGNIIPLAELWPQASFVGVDLSARQVEAGQQCIAGLGLANVQLHTLSVMDIQADFGQFDYIIAHGLYSWVDGQTQQHILKICRQNLHPEGVAFVSFNTRPGWNIVQTVRDLILFHTAQFTDAAAKLTQARAVLAFMLSGLEGTDTPYGKLLKDELNALTDKEDSYLYHEFLEENNHPVYFHEFMARARATGLEYLGDPELQTMPVDNMPPQIAQTLRTINDPVLAEQYMDFLGNRRFRNTLLCHAESVLDRNIGREFLDSFWLAGNFHPVTPYSEARLLDSGKLTFTDKHISISTAHPLGKLVLCTLVEQSGAPLRIAEIAGKVAARAPGYRAAEVREYMLGEMALGKLAFNGMVKLRLGPGTYSHDLPDRPAISRHMAWQLQHGLVVTNCRHQLIKVQEVEAMVLALLDGSRNLQETVRELLAWVNAGKLQFTMRNSKDMTEAEYEAAMAEAFEQMLHYFARMAFFVR